MSALDDLLAALDRLRAELATRALAADEHAALHAVEAELHELLAASTRDAPPRPGEGGVRESRCEESPPAATLTSLPTELIERIVHFLLTDVGATVSLSATSRLFRGTPPVRSPIDSALLWHARCWGLERAALSAIRNEPRPTRVLLEMERVRRGASAHASAFAANARASAFVLACGGLVTCGEERARNARGQLVRTYAQPALGHGGDARAPPETTPRRVAALAGVRIQAVALGSNHLLALSEAGAVYGCGDNVQGQLGLGHAEAVRAPARIGALAGEHVVCIAACEFRSLALTAAGRVYSWGYVGPTRAWHGVGELGHADAEDRRAPALVEGLAHTRIAGVAAGKAHTLALSIAGAVYSFGLGHGGQLGHGDSAHQPLPVRVEALAAVRAVHVSAGWYHSLVVDAEGGVHSFGQGDTGALGLGDWKGQPTPTRIAALAGVRVVRAFAGNGTSLFLDAAGGAHTCGRGLSGVTGHGDTANRRVPARVAALAGVRVTGVALGALHAIAATSDGRAYSWGRASAALGLGHSARDRDLVGPDGEPQYVSVPRRIVGRDRG